MATTSNKRKKAVAATVAAAAILLAGTFAWTSISQQALNESAGIVNVGGRLHDDFNGSNKDVYVENFTDPLDGGQPIYARIRLDEYMEVGPDAGGIDDGDGNKTEFTPVVAGTDREDETTWITHIPNANTENGATCDTDPAGTHVIHEHWEWEMGGKTVFMPTFNKDKDSLESDRNGTYQGTNHNDKVYYDDYVTYTTAIDGKVVEGAVGTTAIKEPVYQRKDAATYDDDTDNEPGGQKRTENETHTAKETASAKVILMKDWNGEAGNFWVYDEDGWAYWANPIMPGEATGLLLSGINMYQNPGEKCYYGINVVAQFATVGDWGYFNDEKTPDQFDGTKEALALLETASENVAKVTVTNEDKKTTIDAAASEEDRSVKFSAETFVGTSENAASDSWTWEVYDANLEPVVSEINADGTLIVSPDETSDALIIAAKSENYPGAVGLSSIAVKVKEVEEVKTLTGIDYQGWDAGYVAKEMIYLPPFVEDEENNIWGEKAYFIPSGGYGADEVDWEFVPEDGASLNYTVGVSDDGDYGVVTHVCASVDACTCHGVGTVKATAKDDPDLTAESNVKIAFADEGGVYLEIYGYALADGETLDVELAVGESAEMVFNMYKYDGTCLGVEPTFMHNGDYNLSYPAGDRINVMGNASEGRFSLSVESMEEMHYMTVYVNITRTLNMTYGNQAGPWYVAMNDRDKAFASGSTESVSHQITYQGDGKAEPLTVDADGKIVWPSNITPGEYKVVSTIDGTEIKAENTLTVLEDIDTFEVTAKVGNQKLTSVDGKLDISIPAFGPPAIVLNVAGNAYENEWFTWEVVEAPLGGSDCWIQDDGVRVNLFIDEHKGMEFIIKVTSIADPSVTATITITTV